VLPAEQVKQQERLFGQCFLKKLAAKDAGHPHLGWQYAGFHFISIKMIFPENNGIVLQLPSDARSM